MKYWFAMICCIELYTVSLAGALDTTSTSAVDESILNASGLTELDLDSMSLDELMNVEVTSVSKKAQRLSDAPAAVFVITQEDIRRSGATSIPEVLRMVPGLQVARINSSQWAISARGFTDRFAYKLLVLLDGRSVYNPLFSGVYWEFQDVVLEDIERIEVIRGPGAALWGSNAVNGVINIITKHAKDTQGGLVSYFGGGEEPINSAIRYGGQIGDDSYYRWYAKYFKRDETVDSNNHRNDDKWDQVRTGFRFDSELSGKDTLTINSNLFQSNLGVESFVLTYNPPADTLTSVETSAYAFDLTSRWERELSDTSNMALQAYYMFDVLDGYKFGFKRHTFDLDFQHRFVPFDGHEILWGLEYRYTTDEINNAPRTSYIDTSDDIQLGSAFLQDEISLIDDELRLIVGSKFEYHDYTGFEAQPNARIIWTPNERHSLWGAVSRAVRTPARAEIGAQNVFMLLPPGDSLNPTPLPALIRGLSRSNPDTEKLWAYEAGYRTVISDRANIDAALFYHQYDNLIDGELGSLHLETIEGTNFFVLPIYNVYTAKANSYGAELSLDIRLTDWWTVKPAYTYYFLDFNNTFSLQNLRLYHDDKYHQASLRSQMDIAQDWEFDLWLRYSDDVPSSDINSYIALDGRIGWNPSEQLQLAVGFQNILDDRHPEFGGSIFSSSGLAEIERNVYARITWRF